MSTKNPARSARNLQDENAQLLARLAEAEETLRAIREGEVDAIVVSGSAGEQVYSLTGAERVYRLVMETMAEAALTTTLDGTVLFCNGRFAEFVGTPMERELDTRSPDQEPLRPYIILSGGWAWHFMSPVGHEELKHAHDHKDVDFFVEPKNVSLVIILLEQQGFKRAPTRFDNLPNNSDFRRYEKVTEKYKHIIDFFVRKDIQVREVQGPGANYPWRDVDPKGLLTWKIVEPAQLLTFYKTIHSSDNCFAVKAADLLLKKGIDPVGRPELIEIPEGKMRVLTDSEVSVVEKLYQNKSEHKNTHAYVTVVKEITLREWNGHHPSSDESNWSQVPVYPGTTLKIVMVSRFGDCGLTNDLSASNGYHIRVDFEDESIKDIRWDPQPTPCGNLRTRFELLRESAPDSKEG